MSVFVGVSRALTPGSRETRLKTMRIRGMLVAAFAFGVSSAWAESRLAAPPQYPPEMVPAPSKALPVVSVEPLDVVQSEGKRRVAPLAHGASYDDIPKPAATVANHKYVSWSGWPIGTEAWWDAESLGEHARRDERRLVDRLEKRSADGVTINEFWATQTGALSAGSNRGIRAITSPDWDLVPRRSGNLVFWRSYRARVTISEAVGPTTRPIAPGGNRRGAGLINSDGFLRSEGVLCTVVEWCERPRQTPATAASQPSLERVRLTREIRHPAVPDGVLETSFGSATLDSRDGIADEKIEYRRVLDRVIVPIPLDPPEPVPANQGRP